MKRRRGRFRVTHELLMDMTLSDVHLLFGGMKIYRAEPMAFDHTVEYWAEYFKFDEVEDGFETPIYQPVITTNKGGFTKVEWQRADEPRIAHRARLVASELQSVATKGTA